VETIIFGPADFMASLNMKSLVVGALIPIIRATRTTTS
jgi:citrate lyase subunit beta/citryl-CoA lyase